MVSLRIVEPLPVIEKGTVVYLRLLIILLSFVRRFLLLNKMLKLLIDKTIEVGANACLVQLWLTK